MLDGFLIWYYFDVYGIFFKSIIFKNDILLIIFDFSDQSVVVKVVFDRILFYGYIIVQQDNNSQVMQWLIWLWDNFYCFG